jgi:hypothetical protein
VFSFVATLKLREMQLFDAFVHRHQMEPVHMPVWTDGHVLQAAGNSSFMVFDAMPVPGADLRDYRVDGAFIVIHGDGSTSVRTVALADAERVVFTSGGSITWAAGDRIYPLRLVELSTSIEVERVTAGLVQVNVVAVCVDDTTLAGAGWPTQYLDVDVLDWHPNRVSSVAASVSRIADTLDFTVGKWRRFDQAGRPFVGRSHEYIIQGRQDVAQLRRWLHKIEGRWGFFGMPNWQADLTLVDEIGASDTTIDVAPIDYLGSYEGLPGRQDVMIRTASATYFRRVDNSASIDANTERLTLDSALGVSLSRQDVLQVCWVDVARLASDEVPLEWVTSEVVRTELAVRQLDQAAARNADGQMASSSSSSWQAMGSLYQDGQMASSSSSSWQAAGSILPYQRIIDLNPTVLIQGQFPSYAGTQVMWQDTAGTIPVTAVNQQVARIDSLVGSHYVTQANAARRPLWGGEDVGLLFDGSDDYFEFDASYSTQARLEDSIKGTMSLIWGFDLLGSTAIVHPWGVINSGTNSGWIGATNVVTSGSTDTPTPLAWRPYRRVDGGSFTTQNITSFLKATGPFALAHITNADTTLRSLASDKTGVNGGTRSGTVSAPGFPIFLGALNNRGTFARPHSGRMRAFIEFDVAISDADFTDIIEPILTL